MTQEQFVTGISRFLQGDFIDMLWISNQADKYSGLMVFLERENRIDKNGTPVLAVSFKTQSEQAELSALRLAMTQAGFETVENSKGFKGGFVPKFEITTAKYRLEKSTGAVVAAVETALGNLQPNEMDGFYIDGSRFEDGPGYGKGIKFQPNVDRLNEIL